MAILVQTLSAKLGIVTGCSLPRNCRNHFSRPVNVGLWIMGEISALATDLAEFLGAALGFSPLRLAALPGGAAHGRRGVRDPGRRATRVPSPRIRDHGLRGRDLARVRDRALDDPPLLRGDRPARPGPDDRPAEHLRRGGGCSAPRSCPTSFTCIRRLSRRAARELGTRTITGTSGWSVTEVLAAMNVAWVINSAMVILSAAVFYAHGAPVQSIQDAHATLRPLVGDLLELSSGSRLARGSRPRPWGPRGQVILEDS